MCSRKNTSPWPHCYSMQRNEKTITEISWYAQERNNYSDPNNLNIRFIAIKVSPSLSCFHWQVAIRWKEKEQTPFKINFVEL